MRMILAVDTSGRTASAAALSEDGILLGSRMIYTERSHSQILLPMVKALLHDIGRTVQDVDVFAAADGPGSYTGLRIGISAVQALCFAGGKSCVGVSTLEGLAWNLCARGGILCACMAARQTLCYCAFFESDGVTVRRLTEDAVLPAEEIAVQIAAYDAPVMLAGDGLSLVQTLAPDVLGAPLHLRYQSACGIAMAAAQKTPVPPEELTVRYLQAVKIG